MNNQEVHHDELAHVFDIGSSTTRLGFNDSDHPSLIIATENKDSNTHVNETTDTKTSIRQTKIIKRGIIQDFEAFNQHLEQSYRLQGADPSDLPIFLSEGPLLPRSNRTKIAEYLF
jgi:actin-related protein